MTDMDGTVIDSRHGTARMDLTRRAESRLDPGDMYALHLIDADGEPIGDLGTLIDRGRSWWASRAGPYGRSEAFGDAWSAVAWLDWHMPRTLDGMPWPLRPGLRPAS